MATKNELEKLDHEFCKAAKAHGLDLEAAESFADAMPGGARRALFRRAGLGRR